MGPRAESSQVLAKHPIPPHSHTATCLLPTQVPQFGEELRNGGHEGYHDKMGPLL